MKRFFTLFCLWLPCVLLAQKNYVAGHIVSKDGKTLIGEINYKEWVINPRKIKFRQAGIVQSYTPLDVRSFKIDAKNEMYESAEVLVNRESLDWDEMPQYQTEKEIDDRIEMFMDTVFLLTLAKGRINLYQLIDENKRLHFYIQKGSGSKEPLIYREVKIMRPGPLITEELLQEPNLPRKFIFEDYKSQLKLIMGRDCGSFNNAIDKLTYSRVILDLVQRYNECTGQSFYIKPPDRAEIFLYGFGGTAQSLFTIQDENNGAAGKMPPGWSSSYGLGFEFGIPRSRRKFSWMVEALYLSGESVAVTMALPLDVGSKDFEYRSDIKGFRFNAMLKYTILTGKVEPYLKFGIGGSSYSKRDFFVKNLSTAQTEKHTLLKSDPIAIAGIGVKAYNFFVEIRYDSANDINRVTGYDLKMRRLSALLGYSLPLNKRVLY